MSSNADLSLEPVRAPSLRSRPVEPMVVEERVTTTTTTTAVRAPVVLPTPPRSSYAPPVSTSSSSLASLYNDSTTTPTRPKTPTREIRSTPRSALAEEFLSTFGGGSRAYAPTFLGDSKQNTLPKEVLQSVGSATSVTVSSTLMNGLRERMAALQKRN